MTVPNSSLIAEVILYCQGFTTSTSLARKLVKLLDFAQKQLNNYPHYDFGLRIIKGILIQAGSLRQKIEGMNETVESDEACKLASEEIERYFALLERKHAAEKSRLIK